MNMELKDLSLDEVVEQLTKLKSMHEKADFWKLRIVLSDGRKWCVGKILGVANDKTGEAEDVFIYSVVYEREKMAAVCAQDDPCAACGELRSRYILLASGLLKPIAPYEAEELD